MRGARAVVRITDICESVWANRDLEEVEQTACTATAKESEVANRADVVHVIACLAHREDRLPVTRIQRLREHDVPLISGGRVRILRAVRSVEDDVDAAVVAGGYPRHDRVPRA